MILLLIASYVLIFLVGFFFAIERYLSKKSRLQTKCKDCVYHNVCLIEEDLKQVQDDAKERYCSLGLKKE